MAPKAKMWAALRVAGRRVARKREWQRKGMLKDMLIKEKTKVRYEKAVAAFFTWLSNCSLQMAEDVATLDEDMCTY